MIFAPNLTINPSSRRHIEAYLHKPTHAVVLLGSYGIGLTTIAYALAESLSPGQPHIVIEPIDGKDLSIDQVRSLYSTTQSVEKRSKVVIIDDAHTMGFDAQNAFLKLLEEPPANVYFLLVVHDLGAILPTILSRSELIEIRAVADADMHLFIDTLTSDKTVKAQLQFLAGGLPAKAKQLTDDADAFASAGDMTRDARKYLEGDYYERFIISNKYATNRELAVSFIMMIGQLILHMSRKQTEQSHKLEPIAYAVDRLYENANVKLQLIHLSLDL